MGLVGTEFQVVFDLPPGLYQYRFLVDGVWRCDDTKPIVRDEYGLISNEMLVTLVENNTHPAVQLEPPPIRRMNLDEGTILTTMPPEPPSRNPGMQIAVFRHRVSEILLHNTIYDVVPVSSKVTLLFYDQHFVFDHAIISFHISIPDSNFGCSASCQTSI